MALTKQFLLALTDYRKKIRFIIIIFIDSINIIISSMIDNFYQICKNNQQLTA